MSGARPPFGPLPEGAPDLEALAARALAPGAPYELTVAHGERLVALGVDPDGRPVVVKVDRSVTGHRREAAVTRRLHAAGVAVPAVLATREVDDPVAGVLVLERVPGEPMGEYGLEDPRFGDETWAAVGAALARLHACPVEPPGPAFGGHEDGSFPAHLLRWAEVDRREGTGAGWMTVDQARRHARLVADLVARVRVSPEVLVHGDCSPQHWLVERPGGPVRAIDMGDSGMGDPAYDLVVLTLTQPGRLAAVLDGYGADAEQRAHLAAVTPGYRALRLAGEVSWLREHGFDPSPAAVRMAAALA